MLPSPLPLPLGTRWFAARGGTRRQRQPQPPPFPSPSLCPAECPGGVPAGISVTWLGDFVAVESGLGVHLKLDGRGTVYVTVSVELRGSTKGLCGPYNDDPTGNTPCVTASLLGDGGHSVAALRVHAMSPTPLCPQMTSCGLKGMLPRWLPALGTPGGSQMPTLRYWVRQSMDGAEMGTIPAPCGAPLGLCPHPAPSTALQQWGVSDRIPSWRSSPAVTQWSPVLAVPWAAQHIGQPRPCVGCCSLTPSASATKQ